jgi:hypothetical protein
MAALDQPAVKERGHTLHPMVFSYSESPEILLKAADERLMFVMLCITTRFEQYPRLQDLAVLPIETMHASLFLFKEIGAGSSAFDSPTFDAALSVGRHIKAAIPES